MTTFIIVLHVIVSFALIFIILLQTGTGAGMGAAFGAGSSQTLFGSSGSSKFLTRLTAIAATIFMLTSLTLTITSAHRVKGTVMEGYSASKPAAPISTQAQPAQPAIPAVVDKNVKSETAVQPSAVVPEKTKELPEKTE
ncbi:MAG: preprotein translocase subunit SecG [Deltaproteobacteria bacterium]|nr:preprotein translocase subunit SecG [Deltaproteobacteria bacterium]